MENNEIQDLKNQLALLQQRLNQLEVAGEPERASRRGMLKLAAGAGHSGIPGELFRAHEALAGRTAAAGGQQQQQRRHQLGPPA